MPKMKKNPAKFSVEIKTKTRELIGQLVIYAGNHQKQSGIVLYSIFYIQGSTKYNLGSFRNVRYASVISYLILPASNGLMA